MPCPNDNAELEPAKDKRDRRRGIYEPCEVCGVAWRYIRGKDTLIPHQPQGARA